MNPSEFIDREIARHRDWRGATMAEIRRIIRESVPDVTEEWKWMGTPTWSHNGILCICNAFKDFVKVTFINGAQLQDADNVFNAELGGKKWRAIKIFEGDAVNAAGLKKLLVGAVALNAEKGKGSGKSRPAAKTAPSKTAASKTSASKTAASKTAATKTAATKTPAKATKSSTSAAKRSGGAARGTRPKA